MANLLGHDAALSLRSTAEDGPRRRRLRAAKAPQEISQGHRSAAAPSSGTKKILSTLRDSDVERAISDVLVNLDRIERPRSDQWDMRSNPLASA